MTDTWRAEAACAGMDPNLFHPETPRRGERMTRAHARNREPLAVCATCPVIDACRECALGTRQRLGIWGGLLPYEREAILRDSEGRCASLASSTTAEGCR